jgi:hypothetical protein
MRFHRFAAAVGLSLVWLGLAQAQHHQEPCAYVPANVLAYVELRQPGTFAKEMASLFEGSVLSNVPESFAKLLGHREEPGFGARHEGWATLGLFLAPELIREMERLDGLALALTGFDDKGEPDFVVLVLPGTSNAPGFVMRALMMMEEVGRLDEVEGVTVYRQVRLRTRRPQRDAQPVLVREQTGPAFAMLPTALLVGSPNAVKAVIRQIKGKNADGSLASVPTFQKAIQELALKPGIFSYANLPVLLKAVLARPGAEENLRKGGIYGDDLQALFKLFNPKAMPVVAKSLSLERGTLTQRSVVYLGAKWKCPFVEMLPSKSFQSGILHFIPRGAFFAIGISNDNGENRWTKMLEMADSLAKDGKRDTLPSQHVEQVETALGAKIGKDILGRISQVAFGVLNLPQIAEGKQGSEPSVLVAFQGVLLIQAVDEGAAKEFATDLIPKVYSLMTETPGLKPIEHDLYRQTIYTLTTEHRPAMHYGRHGVTLILGVNQDAVAAALAAGAKKQGLPSDPKVAAVLQRAGEPFALVVSRPLPVLLSSLLGVAQGEASAPSAPRGLAIPRKAPLAPDSPPDNPPGLLDPGIGPGESPSPGPGQRLRGARIEGSPYQEADMSLKGFMKLAEGAEPFLLTLSRNPDRLIIEARQGGLKPLVAKLMDAYAEQYFKPQSRKSPPRSK